MSEITLSEREQREYRLAASLLMGDDERSGLAWEISDQLRKDLPKSFGVSTVQQNGRTVPFAERNGLLVPYGLAFRAGLDSATSTKGAEVKFQQPKPYIEALRARAVILQLGATVMTGLVGDVKIPRLTAGSTPGAKAENSGSDQADSDIALDQASLIPREYIDTTAYTLQLLAQSRVSSDVDALIRNDLARAHAVKIDADVIAGGGAPALTGIAGSTGVDTTTVVGGTNGAAATWANLTALERTVALANADVKFGEAPDGTEAYLMPPGQRDKLRNKDRTAAGTTGWMCISDDNDINDYPVAVSTSVPSNLTKGTGTNLSQIIFGRFSEIIVGYWGALEIIADRYRLKKQGKVELTSYQLVGTTLRHGQSFAVMPDAV